ncbi:MAG: DUF362 domain-containing protein [Thermodesulfobacteriota bacterium]
MDRREFLKLQAGAALLAAGAASGVLSPGKAFSQANPDIAVVEGAPGAATRASVELLGGMGRFVKKGDRVVIKPNMSFTEGPDSASTTHPEVVSALARMCLESGASSVLVLDNTLFDPESCMKKTGIRDACAEVSGGLVHALSDDAFFQEKKIENGHVLTDALVMKDVLRADKIIAAPVAKSHSGAGVSLSMKGMMGLVLERGIMHRKGLHESIVDLCTIIPAHLAVVDATRVLTSNGPRGPGKVIRPGKVIASADMVAADAYTVASFEWYGKMYKPRQVRHIRMAHEQGLGRMDVENLTVKSLRL